MRDQPALRRYAVTGYGACANPDSSSRAKPFSARFTVRIPLRPGYTVSGIAAERQRSARSSPLHLEAHEHERHDQ